MDRAEWERRIGLLVGRALRKQFNTLNGSAFGALVQPLDLTGLDSLLADAALAAAGDLLATQPVGVEWAGVVGDLAQWGTDRALFITRQMEATTQRNLGRAADVDAVAQMFGPSRAATVGVTETTEAISAGEKALVVAWKHEGFEMTGFWHTEPGACRICRPRDGQRVNWATVGYPPAHLKCRCVVRWLVTQGEAS
jgi:hypothetical protein